MYVKLINVFMGWKKNESSEEEKKSKPFLANFNCNVWKVQEFKAN